MIWDFQELSSSAPAKAWASESNSIRESWDGTVLSHRHLGQYFNANNIYNDTTY